MESTLAPRKQLSFLPPLLRFAASAAAAAPVQGAELIRPFPSSPGALSKTLRMSAGFSYDLQPNYFFFYCYSIDNVFDNTFNTICIIGSVC